MIARAKRKDSKEWIEGTYFYDNDYSAARVIVKQIESSGIENELCVFAPVVDEDTVSYFTGHKLCKGDKVYGGTIAFEETELDDGDYREYFVCTFIKEWSSFIWLPIEEYKYYVGDGVENIDRVFLSMSESHKLHHAGNVFDNKNLLK